MRRLTLAAALLLSACATSPAPQPAPARQPPAQQAPHLRSGLLGMTAAELVQRFGQPALQVREGVGVKLQFRGPACVLDAYLYPPPQGAGAAQVSHVDTRYRSGADAPQPACIAALTRG